MGYLLWCYRFTDIIEKKEEKCKSFATKATEDR
jgi:hypothetical protein